MLYVFSTPSLPSSLISSPPLLSSNQDDPGVVLTDNVTAFSTFLKTGIHCEVSPASNNPIGAVSTRYNDLCEWMRVEVWGERRGGVGHGIRGREGLIEHIRTESGSFNNGKPESVRDCQVSSSLALPFPLPQLCSELIRLLV